MVMTRKGSARTLARHMDNGTLQRKYMAEVLGVAPFPERQQSSQKVPVTVECEELTEFSKALLHKILGSVGLKTWEHVSVAEPMASYHALRFVGFRGREENGGTVHWVLPTLSEMLGDGTSVSAQKKSAWNLLQQFAREYQSQ